MRIIGLSVKRIDYPMRRPFASARRASTVAQTVCVTAHLEGGVVGYGEGAPAPYVTGETVASVARDATLATDALQGLDARRIRHWGAALREALCGPTARAAVEGALLDALARTRHLSLWHWFGGAREWVETDFSLTLGPLEEVGRHAAEARAAGYRTLKIKVGGSEPEVDEARVRAVAAAAPDARLRLDANQSFTPETALRLVSRLLEAGIPVELLEQPVPKDDWEALAAVTRACPVPVIADEAVQSVAQAMCVARTGAAHGINIKLAKCGPLAALEIIAVARAAGLRLMLGCMLESLLGIGAAVHLACGTGAFDYLDLDSHALIGLEPTGRPFAQTGAVLSVDPEAPGHGWEPVATGG
ncbi:MAG: dipeptide epimerase [Armatimonadetes bacterium]|nr:dipeptide epimerase [Armatimonadota bacterium]